MKTLKPCKHAPLILLAAPAFPSLVHMTRFKARTLRLFFLLVVAGATAQLSNAQSTWTGAGADQNWSTVGNWTGGAPGNNAVTFPDGAFPITTNVQGAVNNIVQSSTAITTLTYNNNGAASDFNTTQIPGGNILTVGGNLMIGNAAVAVFATFTGGGSLIAGTNGTSTLAVQSTSGSATLDLSPLTTFVFNPGGAGGPVSLGTSTGGRGTVNLAAVSNNITATTLNLGNNNTSGFGTMNLGNGTNIINADTINMGFSKTVGTMQFLNNAGGGLTIANHTGTGRATLNVSGEASSGSTGTANNGFMLFNGGTVNILGSTLTLGNRVGRAGNSANGVLAFNNGTVDITTINMALNISPTTSGANPANGTISVGGGTLKIGTGGMSMVNQAGTPGAGTLIITNGGTVICSNNIYKSTSIGVGSISMDGGNLIMASIAGTIGVANSIPIDNFSLTNSTLTLPVATSANVVVANFTPDATTQNTINVSAMPSITAYPSQFPIISYTTPDGNLNSFVLGTLPPATPNFQGYISNNVANLSIDLVITNGPLAKADQWGGGINNLWDTATLNWTNAGVAVTYNDLDFVTFNDQAQTGTVNLTATRKPATLNINNSVLNYTFNGVGRISGSTALVKDGTASLTLTETGGDNFSGGITINAGTVVLDDASSAISGGLTIASGATAQIGNSDANGALPAGVLSDEGTLVFKRTDNVLVATVISGGGALTQSGSGTLSLSAVNTYAGITTVGNGTLALTNSGAIASSAQVSVTSATLDVSGVSGSTTLNELDLTNASLNVKAGYLQTNLNVASLNMGGAGNTINVRSLPPIASYPATVTLLQSASPIVGYNFALGSLPAASPAFAGSIALSVDQTAVLLTLTAGPIGVRPSVTWSGVDALANVSTNWSDAQNWLTPGIPAATEPVIFNNTATVASSPFDVPGNGIGGIVNPGEINNIVDVTLTNATLNYANTAAAFHNTQIASGKTLTVNGSVTVNGAGGNVTVLGAGGTLKVTNPGTTTFSVQNGTMPTLDMSGLDTFTATVNQIGVGFNPANAGANVRGTWYLAKTNTITTGVGNFGTAAALVVGGSSGSTAGTGQLYLGQTNALFVDGIVLGASTSTADLIQFNPTLINNPVAYIRGISGDSSRVTVWSLGDATVNINNAASGSGFVNDFSTGTLNARVSTLIVGQGAQGNTVNTQVKGTFNMGAGNLDATTLNIGVGVNGKVGGTGIGIMNVVGGTVVVNSLGLGLGTVATSSGTLNLTNATLVVSNAITIGASTAGGTLNASASTVKLLDATTINGSAAIILDAGSILDLSDLAGGTLTLSGGASLAGNGTVRGSVTIDPGATVSPGASVGALTITNVVNLQGTTDMELDRDGATNDMIRGAALINYDGILNLTVLNSALTIGDSFKLFSAGSYSGAFAIIVPATPNNDPGLAWNTANLTVNGTLSVVAASAPAPIISSITIDGGNVILSGTNNVGAGGTYQVLTSTNAAAPIVSWSVLTTGTFDSNGNFSVTNAIGSSGQRFYILQVP
jgi:autotransporter-associated beta strand protein